jgi:iron complex outermembrane receptor protein
VFAELALPLVGQSNARRGANAITLSLAGRYDRYEDFGDALNPQFGLTWRPVRALKMRSTWGTSFRAPALTQLDTTEFNSTLVTAVNRNDPLSATGRSRVLQRFGGNPDLKEERSNQWTAGFDYTPERFFGLRLSATYHAIRYRDRIATGGTPGALANILFEEDIWGAIIQRNPTAEQVAEICAPLAPTPAACSGPLPNVIVDFRLRNLAYLEERGIDLQVAQRFETARGPVVVELDGTHTITNRRAVTRNSTPVDIVDTLGNVLSYRLRLSADWSFGQSGLIARVTYLPSYQDPRGGASQVPRGIDDWLTVDAGFRWQAGDESGWRRGLEARFNVQNLFNEDPPIANTQYGYDSGNANPYGRVMSLDVIKSW